MTLTPDQTKETVLDRYSHDRKKTRLLLMHPALHALPLDGLDGIGGSGAMTIAALKPKLERIAFALGVHYTRGRGDIDTLYSMVETSIARSVEMEYFPDAREIFIKCLRDAIAHGRATYPDRPSVSAAPRVDLEAQRQAEEAALTEIYRQRRAEAAARKPKRAPGRPPKSDSIKTAEARVNAEFNRRRFEARTRVRAEIDALVVAEASALRLVRTGVDVFAEPSAAPAVVDTGGPIRPAP